MVIDESCIFCGEILHKTNKYICNSCEDKIKLLTKIKKVDNAQSKLKKAYKKYFKKDIDFINERKTIIEKILNKSCDFKSTEEICFAMQLEKQGIKYYPNFKIGDYSIDFLIPSIRKIVEIDGEIYHNNRNNELLRERLINHVVGMDYEFVRIPASYIPRYVLGDIKEILDFVVDKRNFDKRNKDTSWDIQYLEQYIYLQSYLKKESRNGNRKIFGATKKYR